MKKLVGYVISIAGLAVMAIGLGMFSISEKFLKVVNPNYITGIGIAGIVVGVVISLRADKGKKARQAKEEVPIYEGEGKNRKIVGYRKS